MSEQEERRKVVLSMKGFDSGNGVMSAFVAAAIPDHKQEIIRFFNAKQIGKAVFLSTYCKYCAGSHELQVCSGCKDTYYCSRYCQEKDWKCHKSQCQGVSNESRVNGAKEFYNQAVKRNANIFLTASKVMCNEILSLYKSKGQYGPLSEAKINDVPPGVTRYYCKDFGYFDVLPDDAEGPDVTIVTVCNECGSPTDRTCPRCNDYYICPSAVCNENSRHMETCH